ncbi:hypothetical protein ACFQE1_07720 [Halobium palmae]|uniref:Flagellin n=1 Tax=Halobium palmae TaxID=1776492 RepID=A0ABD5RYD2_9EURY
MRDDDRAQAFTLEGLMSALLVLLAVLYAMQAVTTTPGAGEARESTHRLQQEADDVLATVANDRSRDLSRAVRYWDSEEHTFAGARDRQAGYGDAGPPTDLFDGVFARTFTERGYSYNVALRYRSDAAAGGTGVEHLVNMGPPGEDAVSATRTVTLYDNQTLTAPGSGDRELWEYDTDPSNGEKGFYPIPDVATGPVYNVVEVRVIVW